MQRYKILQVIAHAHLAGTEQHVMILLSHTNKGLFQNTVLSFSEGYLLNHFKKAGVKTVVIKRKYKFDIGCMYKIYKLTRRERFDIVHLHCGKFASLSAFLAKIPIIIVTRHGLGKTLEEIRRDNIILKLLDYFLNRIVTKIITVTEIDRNLLIQNYKVEPSKVVTIPNGIEICKFNPSFPDKRILNIGTIARLVPQKGISYLLHAVPEVVQRFPYVKFTIVGDGYLRADLESTASNLGISKHVNFVGYQNDVLRYLSRFDIFVLPSVWEGLPFVILEAMAMAKPVIATDIFGVHEGVKNKETGLLIPPRDSHSIAEAILQLLSNPNKAIEMGKKGRKRIEELFTSDVMAKKIENLYLNELHKANIY